MSRDALNPRQFFHGTDTEIEDTHVRPQQRGWKVSRAGEYTPTMGRVYAATTPELARAYGKHVYQVNPQKGARGKEDVIGSMHPQGRLDWTGPGEAFSFKSPMEIVRKLEDGP